MRRRWLGWQYALMVIGLAVLALLVMDFNNRMVNLQHLSAQKEQVAAQVTSLAGTRSALETQIAYATLDAAVGDEVREERWIREGEIPIVPLAPPGSTLPPPPAPQPTPQPEPNWRIWLSLFVDLYPQNAAP